MASENLQTIIVSKEIAKTRVAAEKLARRHAHQLRAPTQTKSSWRFSQRPSSDFVKRSFRGFPLPTQDGVVLVCGKLKRQSNPNGQRWLQFREGDARETVMAEWDFWMTWRIRVPKAKTADDLRALIAAADKRKVRSTLVRGLIDQDLAKKARLLKITRMPKSVEADERIVRLLREGRMGNPGKPPKVNRGAAPKSKVKKTSSKATKRIVLRSPKTMPDPGPCAWLGSIVEWAWAMPRGESSKKIDEDGNAIWTPNSEWMFMWSPKYKAVVSIKRPRNMYKMADVSRHGGAAKMFETFMARPAANSFEMDVPNVPIHRIGKSAAHIVYRSDKWSPKRLESDYIHKLGKGVQIYCGPSIEQPDVFICFGGKLTLTKRGLVW